MVVLIGLRTLFNKMDAQARSEAPHLVRLIHLLDGGSLSQTEPKGPKDK